MRLSRAGAQLAVLAYYSIQPVLRGLITREALLFRAKSRCVIVPPAINDLGGVLDVQHLVIEDVLDEPLRHVTRVERFADRDGVVDGVVMAENPLGPTLRPGQHWLLELIIEIS